MKSYLKLYAIALAFLIVGGLLIYSPTQPASAQKEQQLSDNIARQIQSLIAEKESRSPAQQKIDSQLLYAAKENRGERISSAVATLEVNVNATEEGMVPVDIKATVSERLLDGILKYGGQIKFFSKQYESITATVPLQALEQIAGDNDVKFISPADRARTNNTQGSTSTVPSIPTRSDFSSRANRVTEQLTGALKGSVAPRFTKPAFFTGSINSEADTTHRAAEARGSFGVDGSGVKIGVLSDGVTNLAASQASGDLGPVTVLPGQTGSGDEGTAMLELIHDLAPGAQLFFATAFTSQASFAQNILDLRTAGCDIIVDDVGYFREAVFQDDNVAQSVNTVTAAGALYFSSAGNEGNVTDNTSGVWEGDFNDSGSNVIGTITIAGGTVHDFGGGVKSDQLLASNGGAPIGLFWSDPLAGSSNDYDLYIIDAGQTTIVNAATNVQNGTQDPVELSTISPGANRRMVIFKKTGAAIRAVHLNTFRGRLAINTVGQTHGHSSAAAAFSCAATPANLPFGAPPNPTGPFPNPHNGTNLSELFSSDGPRRVFFNANGTPITPGNFLFATNGGTVRQKPDITAADGVANTGPGTFPTTFYGTSASAPHAAAIAALVKQAVPALTTAQIRTALTSSAIDIETPGVDRTTGFGIVMAVPALIAAGATPQPHPTAGAATLVNESCPPTNSAVDPGETVTVSLAIGNNGAIATSNLVATLQSNANVLAPSGPQNYGSIPVSGSVSRTFSFTANGNCGDVITLTLQLQDGATNLGTVSYTMMLGALGAPATATYSSGNIAVAIPDNTTVEVPITVPDTGVVTDVNVRVRLNHTFDSDMVISLVAPDGTVVPLAQNRGSSGDNFGSGANDCSGTHTVFDDAAATAISAGVAPFAGTFRPEAPLSAMNGKPSAGTWKLRVTDQFTDDTGTIGCVQVQITRQTSVCNTACAGSARIGVSSTLACSGGNTVATVTISNTGTATASIVLLSTAKLGAVDGAPLPQSLGALAPGASVVRTVVFFGAPSGVQTLLLGGTHSGGSFNSSKKVSAPSCNVAQRQTQELNPTVAALLSTFTPARY